MESEYLILSKPSVCIFKIPPLNTSKGYMLGDWKDMIWEGTVRVTSRSDNITITYVNADKSIFAQAPIPATYQEAVQKCVDSSRGFAIRLQNQGGKFAWVGMAFRDRNDAFDFNICFSDYQKKIDMEKNPSKYENEFKVDKDFSIKDGQKFSLDLGFGNQKKNNHSNQDVKSFSLQAPPGSSKQELSIKKNQNDFGDFSNWSNNQTQNHSSFGDFNDFSNFDYNQSKQGFNLLDIDDQFNNNNKTNFTNQNNKNNTNQEFNLLDI